MVIVKVKVPLIEPWAQKGLEGGVWLATRPGRFTPGKDPVPIVQGAGWTSGPVWTCAKNLAPTGIRYLERPACSQSLYRLSYPGTNYKVSEKNQPLFPEHLSELDLYGRCGVFPLM
jgi:hypothetical protein